MEKCSDTESGGLEKSKINELLKRNSSVILFLVFIFIYSFFYYYFGERIPVNGGLGWDGFDYGNLAKNLTWPVDYYRAQRILPSIVVHFVLKMINIPFTDINVIRVFQIYNAVLLFCSVFLWQRICLMLKISHDLELLAFFSLYVNFGVIKQLFYYPVLTDTTAFFLGIAMLYAYLCRDVPRMFVITFASALTWPSWIYYTFPLLIFKPIEKGGSNPFRSNFYIFLATCIGIIFILFNCLFYFMHRFYAVPDYQYAHLQHRFIFLSILGAGFYILMGVKEILKNICPGTLLSLVKTVNLRRCFILILLLIIVYKAAHLIGKLESQDMTSHFVLNMMYLACVKPFIFLVAHIIYYGPIVICSVLLWSQLCKTVSSYGTGMLTLFLFIFLLSIYPDSRAQIFGFPFLVAFTIKTLNEYRLPRLFYVMFILLSFIFSKVYLPINQATFKGSFLEFPYQYYYMHHGPWMSWDVYVLQSLLVLISIIVLYRTIFNKSILHRF